MRNVDQPAFLSNSSMLVKAVKEYPHVMLTTTAVAHVADNKQAMASIMPYNRPRQLVNNSVDMKKKAIAAAE